MLTGGHPQISTNSTLARLKLNGLPWGCLCGEGGMSVKGTLTTQEALIF